MMMVTHPSQLCAQSLELKAGVQLEDGRVDRLKALNKQTRFLPNGLQHNDFTQVISRAESVSGGMHAA